MKNFDEKLRMYLLSKGFMCQDQCGLVYMLKIYQTKISILCNLQKESIEAYMPDYQYNRINSYTEQDKTVCLDLSNIPESERPAAVDEFIDRIVAIDEENRK